MLLAVMVLVTGCVSGPQVRERYFWPPPPDVPRIEWLGAYNGAADLKKPGLMEMIVGESSEAELQRPLNIAADGKGKVFVVDFKQQAIFVFDMNLRTLHTFGGAGAAGFFQQLSGVAVDGDGNVYAGDGGTRKVHAFNPQEQAFDVYDFSRDLVSIASIYVDKSRKRLLVTDVKGHRVLVYDLTKKAVLFVLGNPETKEAEGEVRFNYPTASTVDTAGNILVCDSMNARIVRFTSEGKFLSEFGRRGDGIGDFNIIKGVAVDSEGHIYVTDGKAHRISIFDEKGNVLLAFGGPYSLGGAGYEVRPGGFLLPNGIYIDQNDRIYIVDQMNGRFQMFQYVTEKYLKEHPITPEAPAAKPIPVSQSGKIPVGTKRSGK